MPLLQMETEGEEPTVPGSNGISLTASGLVYGRKRLVRLGDKGKSEGRGDFNRAPWMNYGGPDCHRKEVAEQISSSMATKKIMPDQIYTHGADQGLHAERLRSLKTSFKGIKTIYAQDK
nr:hypothetical protein Iba_chr02bCG14860 [Ipomoea batatas]